MAQLKGGMKWTFGQLERDGDYVIYKDRLKAFLQVNGRGSFYQCEATAAISEEAFAQRNKAGHLLLMTLGSTLAHVVRKASLNVMEMLKLLDETMANRRIANIMRVEGNLVNIKLRMHMEDVHSFFSRLEALVTSLNL